MSGASFGNHSAIRVSSSERTKIRKFYTEILGCIQTKASDAVDFFRMGDDFYISFLYSRDTLEESEWAKSIWLEIKSNDVQKMKQKILAFGVKEMKSGDKEHLYFQAPGGQVFRLVGSGEDLSRFEK